MITEFEIEKYTLNYRPAKTEFDEVSFTLSPSDAEKGKAINYPHRLIYIAWIQVMQSAAI